MIRVPLLLCLLVAGSIEITRADESGVAATRKSSPHPKRRLVLCNDGGTLGAPDMEAPIGVEGLVRETIDPLRDTMVDTLYWQIGTDPYWGTATHRLSDWYSHRTKVGAVWGSDRDKFKTAGEWRIFRNAQQLMDEGIDPAAVIIEHGHRAGLDVFLSLRCNDGHDSRLPDGLKDVNLAPLKRQHPEWLLAGRDFAKFAYNYAVPEVRNYHLGLIDEAISNYDLDGFDLDLCRQPTLFKPGETEQGLALITDVVGKIRAALDKKSRQAGRKFCCRCVYRPDWRTAASGDSTSAPGSRPSWSISSWLPNLAAGIIVYQSKNTAPRPKEPTARFSRKTCVPTKKIAPVRPRCCSASGIITVPPSFAPSRPSTGRQAPTAFSSGISTF